MKHSLHLLEGGFIRSTLVYITVTQDLLQQASERFRSFGAHCLQVAEGGTKEIGEKSAVPELDAVNERFYRVIYGESASYIAAPTVNETASPIVDNTREVESSKNERMEGISIAGDNGRRVGYKTVKSCA